MDYEKVKNWSFPLQNRAFTRADTQRYARGFGAGLPGALQAGDQKYLAGEPLATLPMMGVALADGEFWQQRPETGIDWKRIVHAAESVTQHRPLPEAGEYQVSQRILNIFDRGAERGAMMVEEQIIADKNGVPYVTIEVSLVLKGDGGFGGPPDTAPRTKLIPEDRAADASVELKTPNADDSAFSVTVALAVAQGAAEGQQMIRGVGCFGLAGRAALHLLCDNQPERLRKFSVRYAGLMFTGETVRVDVWRLEPGRAALRMTAVERNALILDQCAIEYA